MHSIAWLLTGGFARGYRTQILGLITALSALASWAVGDATLARAGGQGAGHLRRSRSCGARVKVDEAKVLKSAGDGAAKVK